MQLKDRQGSRLVFLMFLLHFPIGSGRVACCFPAPLDKPADRLPPHSRQAIKKYVLANNNLGGVTDAMLTSHFNKALTRGSETGVFERPKGKFCQACCLLILNLTIDVGASGPVKIAHSKKATSPPAAKKTESKTAPKAKTETKSVPKTAAAKKAAVRVLDSLKMFHCADLVKPATKAATAKKSSGKKAPAAASTTATKAAPKAAAAKKAAPAKATKAKANSSKPRKSASAVSDPDLDCLSDPY